MFTKEDLIQSFEHETAIIKHLATKLPNWEAAYDYKPNAYQRSMGELMYYLAMMWRAMTMILREWSYNPEKIKAMREEVASVELSEFDALMDKQLTLVKDYLTTITEDEMNETINPFGQWEMKRKQLIFGMHHKNFTAYRMQFFLYLKDAWATQLNTSNLWRGEDSK